MGPFIPRPVRNSSSPDLKKHDSDLLDTTNGKHGLETSTRLRQVPLNHQFPQHRQLFHIYAAQLLGRVASSSLFFPLFVEGESPRLCDDHPTASKT